MSRNASIRRAFVLMSALFFLLQTSCSSERVGWQLQETISHRPAFKIVKIYHATSNPRTGLELEISQSLSGLRSHINIFSRRIPPFSGDSEKALVTLVSDSTRKNLIVSRLKGGQRLLLAPEQTALLISSLKNNQETHIYLEGFEERIISTDFTKFLSKMDSLAAVKKNESAWF